MEKNWIDHVLKRTNAKGLKGIASLMEEEKGHFPNA